MNDPQPQGHMASYIGRREFLATVGGTAVAWPLAARAQERMRRIAMLVGATESDPEAPLSLEGFRQTLNQLGWKEGINVSIDTRWGGGDPDRIRAYAKELIDTAPEVAVADSTPAALALQRESRTTPIIFIQAGNPVGSGLVANLARPGGNVTGFTNYVPSMGGKRSEEHTSELQSRLHLVCRLLLEKNNDHRDVVTASVVIGQLDQLLGDRIQISTKGVDG